MAKNDKGSLKSSKVLKIARTMSFTAMGISLLSLVGAMGGLFAKLGVNNKQEDFNDSITQTAVYQEYVDGETASLEDALYNRDITIDEYNERVEELKKDSVEKFIEAQGTEEQKAQLEKFEGQSKAIDTTARVFRYVSYAGIGMAVASGITTAVGAHKSNKELDDEMEKIVADLRKIERDINPFEEFEEDQIELPNIEEDERI